MDAVGIIPARYQSARFPGKPLADILGKTMIQRVYEQAKKTKKLARNIDILQQFYPELIEAARLLLAKVVEKLTGPELSLSELRQTVEIIERLNSSFFNQQVTQTLIQINNTEVNNKVNNKMTLVQEREARLAQLKSSIEDQQPILMKEAQHADKPES